MRISDDVSGKIQAAVRAALRRRKPNYWVVIASAAAAAGAGGALAQDAQDAAESREIEEVVVTSEFFRPTIAESATKFDLAVQDTPQAVSVLTGDILKTFNTTNIMGVDKFIAGVHSTGDGANTNFFLGHMQARGFVLDQLSGYKIDGFSTIRQFQPDLAVAERVEFVKGPSSVVYGVNNYGGTINTVLKRPRDLAEQNVSAEIGSYGTYRVTGDMTGPLNADGSLRFRLVSAYEDRQSIKHGFFSKRFPIYGRLQWDLSESTTLDTYFLYQKEKAADDFGAFAQLNAQGEIVEPFDLSRKVFLGASDYNDIQRESWQAYGSITHRFAGDYTGMLKVGKVSNRHKYNAIYLYNYGFFNGPTVDVYTRNDSRKVNSQDTELSFGGDFELFGRTHKFMLLAESRIVRFDFTNFPFDNLGTVDEFDPDFSGKVDLIDPVYMGTSNGGIQIDEDRYAAGGQVLFQPADKLSFLVGLRWDRIKQEGFDIAFDPDPDDDVIFNPHNIHTEQTKSNITPRLGVVYKVTPEINAYASYSEGFIPQEGVTRAGGTIDPETGVQYEAGFKGEFLDKRLGASLIGFYIKREDVAVSDPTNDRDLNEDFRVPGRKQEHKGVELEVMGRVAPGLNMIATFAHLSTNITKDDSTFDFADSSQGNPVGGAPKDSGSLFLEYTFSDGPLSQLSINGGASYVGKRPSQERNIIGRFGQGGGFPIFDFSDYTTVDAGLRYEGFDRLTLTLQVSNLFDEDYFNMAEVPICCGPNFLQRGSSREVSIGAAYKF